MKRSKLFSFEGIFPIFLSLSLLRNGQFFKLVRNIPCVHLTKQRRLDKPLFCFRHFPERAEENILAACQCICVYVYTERLEEAGRFLRVFLPLAPALARRLVTRNSSFLSAVIDDTFQEVAI